MRPGDSGRWFPQIYDDHVAATVSSDKTRTKGMFVMSVGGKTITLPPPAYHKNYQIAVASNSANVGDTTIACTGGFLDGGNSTTQTAGSFIVFESIEVEADTWYWCPLVGATSLSLTTEQVQDLVAPFINANLLGITGSYDDAGNATSLTNSVAAYVFTSLTGGTAVDLDSVDGDDLTDGDRAIVIDGNAPGTVYYYVLDDDDGGAESSPTKIQPDTNPGTKMWVLADMAAAMQTYGDATTLLTAIAAAAAAGTQTNCTLTVTPGAPGAIDLDVNIPGQLTTDQEAAVDGAATPSAANVFATMDDITAAFATDPLGTAVAALAAKAVPIDADSVLLVDSADTNNAKETTISELKAVVLSANNVGGAIAGYAAKASPIDADSIAICDSADTNDAKETTVAEFRAVLLAADPLGTIVAGLDAKATPVDADSILLVDSEDTNNAKEVTGTVLKSYLKTYFDTLYGALAAPAAFTPTLDWTTATPEGMTITARQETKGKEVTARLYISSADPGAGGGKLNTITMPAGLVPADVDMKVPVFGFHRKDTGAADTWTDMQAWMDVADGTPANRLITMKNAVVWADNEATELMLTWTYEIA